MIMLISVMLMKNLQVRLVKNKKELEKVFKIRTVVFVDEQKVPSDLELDEFDTLSKAKHVIALYKGKPIGAARIRFIKKKAKLERLALLKKYRGKGFGKAVMDYMVNYCKKKKPKEIILHGQCYAEKFYRKLGFVPRGKTFMDAGIEHIEMYLKSLE